MDHQFIPRREQRKPVRMAAKCQTKNGLRDEGYLSDISAAGCCIATRTLYVSEGMRVLIRPEGMEGLTGVIRWTDGTRSGVEFDTPIYGPVVEHLAELHKAGQTVEVSAC
jgi:hypothetical protein